MENQNPTKNEIEEKVSDYLKRIEEVRNKRSLRTSEEAYRQMDKMMGRSKKEEEHENCKGIEGQSSKDSDT